MHPPFPHHSWVGVSWADSAVLCSAAGTHRLLGSRQRRYADIVQMLQCFLHVRGVGRVKRKPPAPQQRDRGRPLAGKRPGPSWLMVQAMQGAPRVPFGCPCLCSADPGRATCSPALRPAVAQLSEQWALHMQGLQLFMILKSLLYADCHSHSCVTPTMKWGSMPIYRPPLHQQGPVPWG